MCYTLVRRRRQTPVSRLLNGYKRYRVRRAHVMYTFGGKGKGPLLMETGKVHLFWWKRVTASCTLLSFSNNFDPRKAGPLSRCLFVSQGLEKIKQTRKWKNKKISQFFIHWYTYLNIYIYIIHIILLTKLYGTNIMYSRETRVYLIVFTCI